MSPIIFPNDVTIGPRMVLAGIIRITRKIVRMLAMAKRPSATSWGSYGSQYQRSVKKKSVIRRMPHV